ncbi:MAG: tyrosine-type recombinase/integrase [Gordonia sp. (in: high G+C Gram-positive bacteria)]|uniref:tyrosine-type recombinase/integrase n=1 Tax=Gordonia sp. (in: high G+C Gram-positive bacteria) TaxID=84139 RepID=UPI003C74786E
MTQRRNRRSGVEDRWRKQDGTPSKNDGIGKRWRARYVDDEGREVSKGFSRKIDAQTWLDGQTSALVTGTHVAPRDQLNVEQWCDRWIESYQVNRASTVRQARTHIKHIVAEFGEVKLTAIRPTMVKSWIAKLQRAEMKPSYVHALHSRLSQILGDAVHDGLLARNPCSRRTSPPAGDQKPYVATTEQVWALYDAFDAPLRAAVLLGAFVGLRVSEAAALRVEDVDFMRGIVLPVQQWPAIPMKTEGSSQPLPIPPELSMMLAESVRQFPSATGMLLTQGLGTDHAGPWTIEREMRTAKAKVAGLPDGFSFHDFRHYLASLLIASGADVKTVQSRLRHTSAKTTLDTYTHLWPDSDESTRSAIGRVIAERAEVTADVLRTSNLS